MVSQVPPETRIAREDYPDPTANCLMVGPDVSLRHYDDSGIVDNKLSQLHREFVVYDEGQCYPEYRLTVVAD